MVKCENLPKDGRSYEGKRRKTKVRGVGGKDGVSQKGGSEKARAKAHEWVKRLKTRRSRTIGPGLGVWGGEKREERSTF